MAKKDKTAKEKEKTGARYYQRHGDAVDRLVNANVQNSPPVSEKELRKYRHDWLRRIPTWIKILFGKWWFSGSVCFFIFWGLGALIPDALDMYVLFGFTLGVVTDLLLENIIRYFSESEESYSRFLMFPKKGLWTLFLNIPYAFILLSCVMWLYNVINLAILSMTGAADTVPLGVGPILFGLFYMGFDLAFVSIRNLFKRIIRDAKEKIAK